MFKSLTRVVLLSSVLLAPMAQAEQNWGAYLAGRQAILNSDYADAADYYSRALLSDPTNPGLMEEFTLAQLAQGNIDRAYPVASEIEGQGLRSQVANMVVVAYLAKKGDYDALLSRDPEERGIGPLIDGLIAAWAEVGAGRLDAGLERFDIVATQDGLRSFALFQKVLALASVGDFAAAEAVFEQEQDNLNVLTRRAAMARVEILSQLGRNEDALKMLTDAFGARLDPSLQDMGDRLAAGDTLPFTHVRTPQDGFAEVFFTLAQALQGEASDEYSLVFSQVAHYLREDHIDAVLLNAELLESLGQYELAVRTYANVPRDHPDFHAAEQGRAGALRAAGRVDAAIEVLSALSRDYPELASVHTGLGDLLRQEERYGEAIGAYDLALDTMGDGNRARWFVLYARGISHEREDMWPEAEADFRAALELNPDHPQVLNYLGYSLVEKQINLDEALAMIETAVAARPDSGFIVDSLGWVLYRLGRFDEAVGHMEKAVELMPVDPVVNDHLGDVYWSVGRYREAEFQWKRALSFIDPNGSFQDADPDRIRRKLEVGLDQVLEEEAAEPVADPEQDKG